MSLFDKREEAFERSFAHDEELRFKATVRRDGELARWAAAKLGKTGEGADVYVTEVLLAELREGGEEAVFRKLRADFDKAGVKVSDHKIRSKMDELLHQAAALIRRSG